MDENPQTSNEKEENEARDLFHGRFRPCKGPNAQMGSDDFRPRKRRREDSEANCRRDFEPHLPVCVVSCYISPFSRPQNQIGKFLMLFWFLGWCILALILLGFDEVCNLMINRSSYGPNSTLLDEILSLLLLYCWS